MSTDSEPREQDGARDGSGAADDDRQANAVASTPPGAASEPSLNPPEGERRPGDA